MRSLPLVAIFALGCTEYGMGSMVPYVPPSDGPGVAAGDDTTGDDPNTSTHDPNDGDMPNDEDAFSSGGFTGTRPADEATSSSGFMGTRPHEGNMTATLNELKPGEDDGVIIMGGRDEAEGMTPNLGGMSFSTETRTVTTGGGVTMNQGDDDSPAGSDDGDEYDTLVPNIGGMSFSSNSHTVNAGSGVIMDRGDSADDGSSDDPDGSDDDDDSSGGLPSPNSGSSYAPIGGIDSTPVETDDLEADDLEDDWWNDPWTEPPANDESDDGSEENGGEDGDDPPGTNNRRAFMTGGGQMSDNGSYWTHSVGVRCDGRHNGEHMTIQLEDGAWFRLEEVEWAVCVDDPAIDSVGSDTVAGMGWGNINGEKAEIWFRFTDAGEPNGGVDDGEFEIESETGSAWSGGGAVTEGNHQMHHPVWGDTW